MGRRDTQPPVIAHAHLAMGCKPGLSLPSTKTRQAEHETNCDDDNCEADRVMREHDGHSNRRDAFDSIGPSHCGDETPENPGQG